MNTPPLDLSQLCFPGSKTPVDASAFQREPAHTSRQTPWDSESAFAIWDVLALASEAAIKQDRAFELRENVIPAAEDWQTAFGTDFIDVELYESELRELDEWLSARGFESARGL